jgi:glucokinase
MEKKILISKESFLMTDYSDFALVSDIGGTSTPMSLFGKKHDGTIEQIFTLVFESKSIHDFVDIINYTLKFAYDEYNVNAEQMSAVFGVSGPIENERTYAKPTNLLWDVDVQKIINGSFLKNIVLLNDFETVGFAIDVLEQNKIAQLNSAKREKGTVAVIGAGTGLGMGILYYNHRRDLHIPIASEGGHMFFQAVDEEDSKIAKFLMKKRNLNSWPDYEEFVSGRGLAGLYDYFSKSAKKKNKEIENAPDKTAAVAMNCNKDKFARKAMDSFLKYYGRAASTLALTAVSFDGIFIAGGIAPKIIDEMKNGIFLGEFEQNPRQAHLLKKIPVYVILNRDSGLFGAANAAFNFFEELRG